MHKSYKSYTLLVLTLKLNPPLNHSLARRYTLMRGFQISYLPFTPLQESDRATWTQSELNLGWFLHPMTRSHSTPDLRVPLGMQYKN